MQSAQRSRSALYETLREASDGPLKDRLNDVAERLDDAIVESWAIAKRGDEIDAAIKRIDPVRLRSQLDDVASVRTRWVDGRSRGVGGEPAGQRRPAEGAVGDAPPIACGSPRRGSTSSSPGPPRSASAAPTTAIYEHDVDNLVIELEGLRQAVAETNEIT